MRQRRFVLALSVLLPWAGGPATAQTQRNPTGTSGASSTLRNPTDAGGGTQAPAKPPGPLPSAPTRPPLGSGAPAAAAAAAAAPGLAGSAAARQGGANLGAGARAGLRPNGGSGGNGSKPAPMQANGVRKVE